MRLIALNTRCIFFHFTVCPYQPTEIFVMGHKYHYSVPVSFCKGWGGSKVWQLHLNSHWLAQKQLQLMKHQELALTAMKTKDQLLAINVNPSDCLDAVLHHLLPLFTSPHELTCTLNSIQPLYPHHLLNFGSALPVFKARREAHITKI